MKMVWNIMLTWTPTFLFLIFIHKMSRTLCYPQFHPHRYYTHTMSGIGGSSPSRVKGYHPEMSPMPMYPDKTEVIVINGQAAQDLHHYHHHHHYHKHGHNHNHLYDRKHSHQHKHSHMHKHMHDSLKSPNHAWLLGPRPWHSLNHGLASSYHPPAPPPPPPHHSHPYEHSNEHEYQNHYYHHEPHDWDHHASNIHNFKVSNEHGFDKERGQDLKPMPNGESEFRNPALLIHGYDNPNSRNNGVKFDDSREPSLNEKIPKHIGHINEKNLVTWAPNHLQFLPVGDLNFTVGSLLY